MSRATTVWTGLRAKLGALLLNSARRRRRDAPFLQAVLQDFRKSVVGTLLRLLHHAAAHGPLRLGDLTRLLTAAGLRDVTLTPRGLRYIATARKQP